jgi:hypothetical protein
MILQSFYLFAKLHEYLHPLYVSVPEVRAIFALLREVFSNTAALGYCMVSFSIVYFTRGKKIKTFRAFFSLLFLLKILPLWPQAVNANYGTDEKLSFVGMTLAELIERFGAPKTVIAERGNEIWQDDVIFRYDAGDFYIYNDHVWQIKFVSALGISNKDRKPAVLKVLGNNAEDRGDYALLQIPGMNWPLTLRVNFNNSQQVSAIYLYRPDF